MLSLRFCPEYLHPSETKILQQLPTHAISTCLSAIHYFIPLYFTLIFNLMLFSSAPSPPPSAATVQS